MFRVLAEVKIRIEQRESIYLPDASHNNNKACVYIKVKTRILPDEHDIPVLG